MYVSGYELGGDFVSHFEYKTNNEQQRQAAKHAIRTSASGWGVTVGGSLEQNRQMTSESQHLSTSGATSADGTSGVQVPSVLADVLTHVNSWLTQETEMKKLVLLRRYDHLPCIVQANASQRLAAALHAIDEHRTRTVTWQVNGIMYARDTVQQMTRDYVDPAHAEVTAELMSIADQLDRALPIARRMLVALIKGTDYTPTTEEHALVNSAPVILARLQQMPPIDQPRRLHFNRCTAAGLSLVGACSNPQCSEVQWTRAQRPAEPGAAADVLINLGYGRFNMRKEVKAALCPACQLSATDPQQWKVKTLLLASCRFELEKELFASGVRPLQSNTARGYWHNTNNQSHQLSVDWSDDDVVRLRVQPLQQQHLAAVTERTPLGITESWTAPAVTSPTAPAQQAANNDPLTRAAAPTATDVLPKPPGVAFALAYTENRLERFVLPLDAGPQPNAQLGHVNIDLTPNGWQQLRTLVRPAARRRIVVALGPQNSGKSWLLRQLFGVNAVERNNRGQLAAQTLGLDLFLLQSRTRPEDDLIVLDVEGINMAHRISHGVVDEATQTLWYDRFMAFALSHANVLLLLQSNSHFINELPVWLGRYAPLANRVRRLPKLVVVPNSFDNFATAAETLIHLHLLRAGDMAATHPTHGQWTNLFGANWRAFADPDEYSVFPLITKGLPPSDTQCNALLQRLHDYVMYRLNRVADTDLMKTTVDIMPESLQTINSDNAFDLSQAAHTHCVQVCAEAKADAVQLFTRNLRDDSVMPVQQFQTLYTAAMAVYWSQAIGSTRDAVGAELRTKLYGLYNERYRECSGRCTYQAMPCTSNQWHNNNATTMHRCGVVRQRAACLHPLCDEVNSPALGCADLDSDFDCAANQPGPSPQSCCDKKCTRHQPADNHQLKCYERMGHSTEPADHHSRCCCNSVCPLHQQACLRRRHHGEEHHRCAQCHDPDKDVICQRTLHLHSTGTRCVLSREDLHKHAACRCHAEIQRQCATRTRCTETDTKKCSEWSDDNYSCGCLPYEGTVLIKQTNGFHLALNAWHKAPGALPGEMYKWRLEKYADTSDYQIVLDGTNPKTYLAVALTDKCELNPVQNDWRWMVQEVTVDGRAGVCFRFRGEEKYLSALNDMSQAQVKNHLQGGERFFLEYQ